MRLGDILQASDDLSHAVNSYQKIVDGRMISGEMERPQQQQAAVSRGTFVCRSILMKLGWKCMREQNHEIVVDGETPASHAGSDPGSLLAEKNQTFIDFFFSLPCAVLSVKPLEEHAPAMQQEQLWCKLMQPVNILVCSSSKEFVLNISVCEVGACVLVRLWCG